MLNQNVYTLGTAATTVVAPTVDSGRYILKSLQPDDIDDYSKDGYLYCFDTLVSLVSGAPYIFSFTTGDTGAQLAHWEIVSTTSNVYAELLEGGTVVTTGDPLPTFNHNRNYDDDATAVLRLATSVTGGTATFTELPTGSNQASSGVSSGKIVTLEPNTQYAFRYTNLEGATTDLHVHLEWSELYNGYQEIWLGAPDESYVLKGGEEVSMYLRPQETINATGGHAGCRLAVMRQD